jgi:hypothetical protein
MNNFCIAHASFLVDEKSNKHIFVFTPSVEVQHFWVDLDERHVFTPTPNVGVGHIYVVCTCS